MKKNSECQLAPKGWYCTRRAGHGGPCAAWPDTEQMPAVTVKMWCPACGSADSLFVGAGGYLTCAWIDCPNPDFADALKKYIDGLRQPERRNRDCSLCPTEIAMYPCVHALVTGSQVTMSRQEWERMTRELNRRIGEEADREDRK